MTGIQGAYTHLWTAFVDAAQSQGLGADPENGNGALVSVKDGVTTARTLFLLRGWPYKAVSDKRSVDIAVQVDETFSEDLMRITHAATRVGYFWRAQESSRPLLELHYDFETPAKEAHPVFHAQLGATQWNMTVLEKLGLIGPIERTDERDYANARIPTAFMGYGPILVALAADHLKPKSFRLMMKAARGIDLETIDPVCLRFLETILPSGIPHAHHWYDDRYIVYEWIEGKGKVARAAVPLVGEVFSGREPGSLRGEVAKRLDVPVNQLQFEKGPPPAAKIR